MPPRFGTHSLEVHVHVSSPHWSEVQKEDKFASFSFYISFYFEFFLEERKSRNKGYAQKICSELFTFTWSPGILKPLCLRGQEWKRLRERFAKESCGAVKGFPLGFPTLQVSTYLWKRGGSLILRCQGGRRRPQVEATETLIIQLTPCCQSVLAVMLAKAWGFGRFYLLLDLNQ